VVRLKEKKKPGRASNREKTGIRRGKRTGGPVTSLHQRILADIQSNILSGRWQPGHRIPVESELQEQYGCSRMTVSKVLAQLAHAGVIERRRKAGSFVRRPQSQSAVLSIHDIKTEVEALGLPYRFEILERHKRRANSDDLALLSLDEPVAVLELICRHFAQDQPFCLEHRLINLHAVPAAAAESFAEMSPGAWLLQQVPWNTAEHRIRAAGAAAEDAARLKVKSGIPCLIIERTTRSPAFPITFVRLTYPGNLHELVATFTSLGPR
jgi:GntR family histidine utilization transcriptional repressor